MEVRDQINSRAIVRADSQGLTVRSAGLVRRGLRDLARDSNWLIKKVFAGRSAQVAISDKGNVCAIPNSTFGAPPRLILFDIEMNVPMMALSVPSELPKVAENLPTAFAWSPGSRYLVAASELWRERALHIFDLHSKMLLGTFGEFTTFPARLEWSTTGAYFAAASAGGKRASLRLWTAVRDAIPFPSLPTHEMGLPDWFERQTYEAEFGEEGAFSGYGRTAFSPDGKTLASVVENSRRLGRRLDCVGGRGDAGQEKCFSRAGTRHRRRLEPGQQPDRLLRVGSGVSPRRQYADLRAAAIWCGILRVPPASAAVSVFQFVAEKFGQGSAVYSGSKHAKRLRRTRRGKYRAPALGQRGPK